ncbi:MAG: glycosyltransferase family 2 protein [Smithella sp.]|nr:glycosyltransferase family 2 protein [Smithella sp.]
MAVASITITRNDFHILEQWKKFYDEYKDAINKHIIVDNDSTAEYKTCLRELFPNSILIERDSNGGTTAAYNDGIKRALEDKTIDAIILLANDIKIDAVSIKNLYKFLLSDNRIGAVAPILLDADCRTIVAFGETLSSNFGLVRYYSGEQMNDTLPDIVESKVLPGGMNMVKTEVYRNVGLQDESLFMYMDENDFFYRVGCAGYRMVAFKSAISAHCHIALEKGRHNDSGLAFFYIYRNHLLVCKRYVSTIAMLKLFCRYFFLTLPKYTLVFIWDGTFNKIYYSYYGLFAGLLGIKKNSVIR